MAIENEQKIGVWIEDGVIYRRDSIKEPFARSYTPLKPEDTPEVVRLVNLLQDGANMSAWTPEVEAHQDELVEELGKLTK